MNDDTAMEDPFGTAKQDTVAVDTGTVAAPVTFDDAPDAKTAAVTTTTTAENAASAEEVVALEKKIADLEKTVQQLKTSTVRKDDVAGLKAALAKFEKPVATTPKKASTPKTDETATAAPVKTTAKKPVVRKTWVLRSAKPGMAWISEKNSSELKTVSVGDNVAGIGKVTAIAKDDAGRWVVNGTSGKINQ